MDGSMVDKKISDLGANSTLSGSNMLNCAIRSFNVKALLSAIKTFYK